MGEAGCLVWTDVSQKAPAVSARGPPLRSSPFGLRGLRRPPSPRRPPLSVHPIAPQPPPQSLARVHRAPGGWRRSTETREARPTGEPRLGRTANKVSRETPPGVEASPRGSRLGRIVALMRCCPGGLKGRGMVAEPGRRKHRRVPSARGAQRAKRGRPKGALDGERRPRERSERGLDGRAQRVHQRAERAVSPGRRAGRGLSGVIERVSDIP